MKQVRTISILAVATGLVLATAVAAQPRAGGRCGGRGGPPGTRPCGPVFGSGEVITKMLDHRLKTLPKALEMTEEQRKTYGDVEKKHREAVTRLMNELREQAKTFRAQLNEILTVQQRERLAQMRTRVRERFRRGPEEARMAPRLMKKACEQIDLPPEKKEQVAAILKEATEKIEATQLKDRTARRKMFREMIEKIRTVLSPDEFDRLQDKIHELGQSTRRPGVRRRGLRGDRPPPQNRPLEGRRYSRGRRPEHRPQGPPPAPRQRPAVIVPDWLW